MIYYKINEDSVVLSTTDCNGHKSLSTVSFHDFAEYSAADEKVDQLTPVRVAQYPPLAGRDGFIYLKKNKRK